MKRPDNESGDVMADGTIENLKVPVRDLPPKDPLNGDDLDREIELSVIGDEAEQGG
jgi:hypothetical protein